MATKPVWTILKILHWTKQYFAEKGLENPRLDAEILLCAVLRCERIALYVDFERPLSNAELEAIKKLLLRRAAHEPLAYILGEKAFLRNSFKVTPATLIPRPETELLAESAIKAAELAAGGRVSILDIGTGSGAIILSLLDSLPAAKGVGVDIAAAALDVARENASRLGVADRVRWLRSDVYGALPAKAKFDIIVANPPYIPSGDMAALPADVRREPRAALDGGADGLVFYRRIAGGAARWLAADGMLALEVGIRQAEAVRQLCRAAGFAATAVRRDYANIDRMVFAAKEGSRYADHLLEITK